MLKISPQKDFQILFSLPICLFDRIIEDYPDNEEHEDIDGNHIGIEDETILEMEKEVHSLNGLIAKFQYLSHALPIPAKQYNELLYPDIHIIKSISSHLSAITKMERIAVNTTE